MIYRKIHIFYICGLHEQCGYVAVDLLHFRSSSNLSICPNNWVHPTNFSSAMVILQFCDLETILMALGGWF